MSTLVSLLKERAQISPNHIAYSEVFSSGAVRRSVSYLQLFERVVLLQSAMSKLINHGDRVLITLPSGILFIEAFFAVLAAGGIVVPTPSAHPLFWKRSNARLVSIVKSADPKVHITNEASLNLVKPYTLNKNCSIFLIDKTDIFNAENQPLELAKPEDIAVIQFTSGTQKNSKGVPLSHQQIISNLKAICRKTGQDRFCKLVTWLPHSHDMGLIGGLLVPFMAQGTCIIMDTMDFIRDPMSWLRVISKNGGTTSPSPSFGFDLCSNRFENSSELVHNLNLKSWKIAFNGAEVVRAKSISRFVKNFAPFGFDEKSLYPCYGLAEATLMVSGSSSRRKPKALIVSRSGLMKGLVEILEQELQSDSIILVSCGSAVDEIEIKIVNPTDGKVQDFPNLGEIWIRGTSVARGYWSHLEESEKFNNVTADGLEGFFRTADIGFIIESELFILGRMDDVYILRGEKYIAEEIEETLREQISTLKNNNFAVIGIDEKISALKLICELPKKDLNDSQVKETLRRQILNSIGKIYLLKCKVLFLPRGSIIKTASGKISRGLSNSLWSEI